MLILILLVNIKEKSTIVKINSGGIYFVITIVLFLLAVGIRALIINTFTTDPQDVSESEIKCSNDWNCLNDNQKIHISLYEPNFLILAGMLTMSFFTHNCIVIMMKNNEHQEHNTRDLSLGYGATGLCYLAIGIFGYFGFKGNGFAQQSIAQNALDMFSPTNPLAFIIRIVLFTQMLTLYPMLIFFIRTQLFGFYCGTD